MFDVFNNLATDRTLELQGAWFDIGQGARIKVARANNRHYAKALRSAVEVNKDVLDREDDVSAELSETIFVDVMAKTILLGWEGIGFKGTETPYSVDNAKVLLAVGDFRELVDAKSRTFDAYKVKDEDTQGKA